MRVLLDECLPRRLRSELTDHYVQTVAQMGWVGVKNGQLIQKAASEFDCFVTVDRNLQFQQHIGTLPVAVLVIRARGNRIEDLLPLMPELLRALAEIAPRELRVVGV
jgi:predicted nuclease of predicted toxin-antitoxin system